jgi:hypothetical protein
MAGSYHHMTTRSGKLLNNESFCDMIENLGDAYEAAEDCYGMIWWLARAYWPGLKLPEHSEPPRTTVMHYVEEAVKNHQAGLRYGGVQKPR